ncbi:MAG: DUF2085 domain-containing protein [Candidatus Altiarchaeota archaeon]
MMEFLLLSLLVYLALDAIILAWFFLTPILVQSDNRLLFGLGMVGYNYGYLTSNCHQMPQRSLLIGTFQIPFCARDTAIYIGCLFGGILPFLKVKTPGWVKSMQFFILSMVPMAVDGVSQTSLDMRESSNELRVATGVLFGFGLVYFFAVRIVEHSRNVEREYKAAIRIGLIFTMLIFAAAYMVGDDYVTEADAIRQSGLNPTFITYASHRTLETLRYDQYLPTYDDAVLDELVKYGNQGHGVWVIYEGQMNKEGKYVYFSKGEGEFKLVSDAK